MYLPMYSERDIVGKITVATETRVRGLFTAMHDFYNTPLTEADIDAIADAYDDGRVHDSLDEYRVFLDAGKVVMRWELLGEKREPKSVTERRSPFSCWGGRDTKGSGWWSRYKTIMRLRSCGWCSGCSGDVCAVVRTKAQGLRPCLGPLRGPPC